VRGVAGRQVVELLLDSACVQSLIDASPQLDNLDNERTTCLHLAARNGHVDIIKYVYIPRRPAGAGLSELTDIFLSFS